MGHYGRMHDYDVALAASQCTDTGLTGLELATQLQRHELVKGLTGPLMDARVAHAEAKQTQQQQQQVQQLPVRI